MRWYIHGALQRREASVGRLVGGMAWCTGDMPRTGISIKSPTDDRELKAEAFLQSARSGDV